MMPWEKYAEAAPTQEEGPWVKYQKPVESFGEKRKRELAEAGLTRANVAQGEAIEPKEALEDPWIDPVSAASGGFGGALPSAIKQAGKIGVKVLTKPIASGISGAAADYPIGAATEHIGEKYPKAALPFNVVAGMGSGMTLERLAEEVLTNPKAALDAAKSVLANQHGMVEVWHGSPHKFDKFSMDKIGTGEGAQAFGHGLYFTDRQDIADHYSKMADKGFFDTTQGTKTQSELFRTARQAAIDAGITPLSQAETVANTVVEGILESGSLTKYLKDYDVVGGKYGKYYQPVVDAIKGFDPKKAKPKLYKTTLFPNRTDEVWLGWYDKADKKTWHNLEAQLRKEREYPEDTLNYIKGRITQLYADKAEDATGAALYDSIAEAFGGQKEASAFLKRAGIDGIRYPAGSLSGGGEGTNYVVFDDSAIRIDEVNGKIPGK